MSVDSPLKLDALSLADCLKALVWRNSEEVHLGLRTPYLQTSEEQERFYREVVSNPQSGHRYWAVRQTGRPDLVAMVGLTDIAWENGYAEVSLLVAPESRGEGVGSETLRLVLTEAFGNMRLVTVLAEVYTHNPALEFWRRQAERYRGHTTVLPRRKLWSGKLHDSLCITFTADTWMDSGGK